ncbi:MAG: hypothetical protein KatS3mg023_2460 [Armatimonadota bacterium]|nr:MAG: hypothetical protein KatS3mg023_2460 [Armatimonadota bacterium]
MISSTLLAIDAGGTKTDLLWAQPDGHVLAHVQGQGMNIASKPPGTWQEILEDLLRRASVNRETVHVVCVGAAGYTLPDRRALLEHLLQQMLPGARVLVLADYAIALEGATGGNPGVLVIAGYRLHCLWPRPRGQAHARGGMGIPAGR